MITLVNPATDDFSDLFAAFNNNSEAIPVSVLKNNLNFQALNHTGSPLFTFAENPTKDVVLDFGSVTHDITNQKFDFSGCRAVVGDNSYNTGAFSYTYTYAGAGLFRWDVVYLNYLGVVNYASSIESKKPIAPSVLGTVLAFILVSDTDAVYYTGAPYDSGQSYNERLAWIGAKWVPRGTHDLSYAIFNYTNDGDPFPDVSVLNVDTSGDPFSVALTPRKVDGAVITVKDMVGSCSTNTFTLNAYSCTIEGLSDLNLTQDYEAVTLQWIEPTSNFIIISRYIP